jgi:hypothetical protein
MRTVSKVNDQIGVGNLLESRLESLYHLHWEICDEPDCIEQTDPSP